MTSKPSAKARRELIDGLTELASFLRSHPDVPVEEFQQTTCQYSAYGKSYEEEVAEVEGIAAQLGIAVSHDTTNDGRRTAKAELRFGPVQFIAFCSEDHPGGES